MRTQEQRCRCLDCPFSSIIDELKRENQSLREDIRKQKEQHDKEVEDVRKSAEKMVGDMADKYRRNRRSQRKKAKKTKVQYKSLGEVLRKKFNIKLTEKEIRRLWSEVDVTKRGAVEEDEFREWCTRMGIDKYCDVEKMYDAADQRDFGMLDFGEFRCCLLERTLIKLSKRELRGKFKEFDTNKSGVLEYPEFERACVALQFAVGEDLHQFFESVDEDQNGVISYDEFAKAILGQNIPFWL